MTFLYGPGFDVKNRIFTHYSLSKNDIRAFTTESVCVKTLRFCSPAAFKGAELSLGGLAQEKGPQQTGFQPTPASAPETHGCSRLHELKGRVIYKRDEDAWSTVCLHRDYWPGARQPAAKSAKGLQALRNKAELAW